MNPAPHLVLIGPMGAGKSSLGRRLADLWGLPFVDLDHEIETRAGTAIPTIFACEGESGFRRRECETLAQVLSRESSVVATGGGAVLDPGNRALIRLHGFVVHLDIDLDEQLQRLARDRSRPLLVGADRSEVLARLAAERGPLYAEVADLTFPPAGMSPTDAAEQLAERLQDLWRCPDRALSGNPSPSEPI